MKTFMLIWWDKLRTSFWFQPSLMAIGAIGLAFGSVALDDQVTKKWLDGATWVYSGGVDGARAVLQTIAGSMITIAGVVFSLTLVALSIASSQFGSRLLRNFMRDATNQTVLGTFIATFLYCLLVLRSIRSESVGGFVPHISVTLGVLLALASLWMLIYFIHHVAVSIQADEIVARVGSDLNDTVDRLFPESTLRTGEVETGGVAPNDDRPWFAGPPDDFAQSARPIEAAGDGYLQRIDLDSLVTLGKEKNLVFRLSRRPGHYLVRGTVIGSVWPPHAVSDELMKQVQDAFVVGNQRTLAQDAEFGILQLVEVAVRALSPGINDPFTAIACVDRLGSVLVRLARRNMPSPYQRDDDGAVRVIVSPLTFSGMIDAAFNPLRQYARNNADVTIRMLESIAIVAGAVQQERDRESLRRHATMIVNGADAALPEEQDRHDLQLRYIAVLRALDAGSKKSKTTGDRDPAEE